jgi:hypothetical protein
MRWETVPAEFPECKEGTQTEEEDNQNAHEYQPQN